MDNYGQSWSTMFHKIKHGQPWSNVTLPQRLCCNENKALLSMVNHSPTLHYDKDCLNMEINHGQPWSAMFISLFIIFSLGFITLGFINFIPWVYYSPRFIISIHWVY